MPRCLIPNIPHALNPPTLNPDKKVFFLETTGELFQTYSEYFDRAVLIASTDWQCELSRNQGLLYQEALDSELDQARGLREMPLPLVRGILCLVKFLSTQGGIGSLVENIYTFLRAHFFVDEEATLISVPGGRKVIVVDVHLDQASNQGDLEEENINLLVTHAVADRFRYIYKEEDTNREGKCRHSDLKRKRMFASRDKIKALLCFCLEKVDGIWWPKANVMEKFRVRAAWLSDAWWAGILPHDIEDTRIPRRRRVEINLLGGQSHVVKSRGRPAATIQTSSSASDGTDVNKSKKEKKELASMLHKTMVHHQKKPEGSKSNNGKLAALEQERIRRLIEKKMAQKAEKDKERMRLTEEKAKEKEQRLLKITLIREDMRRLKLEIDEANRHNQWLKAKTSEDLALAASYGLVLDPEFSSINLRSGNSVFGDIMQTLEFLQVFSHLLDFDSSFLERLQLEEVDRSLVNKTTDSNLYGQLIMALLDFIFTSLPTPDFSKLKEIEEDDGKNTDAFEIKRRDLAISLYSRLGIRSLEDMPLDERTVSEVLRLHLILSPSHADIIRHHKHLSSFFYPGDTVYYTDEEKWRAHTNTNLYDLKPNDKMMLVNALIQEIVELPEFREQIEVNYLEAQEIKKDMLETRQSLLYFERERSISHLKKALAEKQLDLKKCREEGIKKRKKAETKGDDTSEGDANKDGTATPDIQPPGEKDESGGGKPAQEVIEAKIAKFKQKYISLTLQYRAKMQGCQAVELGQDRAYRK